MNNDELSHFGVLGMKWGRRKGSTSSGGKKGGRKTGVAGGVAALKGADQRKANAFLGKRNRTKMKKFLLGDPDKFIKNFSGVNKKYKSLPPEKRAQMKKRIATVQAAASVASMAAIVYMITR